MPRTPCSFSYSRSICFACVADSNIPPGQVSTQVESRLLLALDLHSHFTNGLPPFDAAHCRPTLQSFSSFFDGAMSYISCTRRRPKFRLGELPQVVALSEWAGDDKPGIPALFSYPPLMATCTCKKTLTFQTFVVLGFRSYRARTSSVYNIISQIQRIILSQARDLQVHITCTDELDKECNRTRWTSSFARPQGNK